MARDMYKRRRYCRFSAEGISEVDYKDIGILKDFITENGIAWDTPPTSPTDSQGYEKPNLEMFSLLRVLGKGSFGKV